MARDPRLAALRGALRTRRAGWQLVAALALLGMLLGSQRLGWHRLTGAAGLVSHALAQATAPPPRWREGAPSPAAGGAVALEAHENR
jgi:hypothetical protein